MQYPSQRRRSSLAASVGLCLLLTACSPASYSATVDASGAEPELTSTITPARDPNQGALDELTDRIWGTMPATQQEAQADMERRVRAEEEFIAGCMAAQGFTYYPMVAAMPTVMMIEGPARGTREFAEQFGLGISAIFAGDGLPGSQRVASAVGMGHGHDLDPNRELRAAMSAAEQEAWWQALLGEHDTWDWEMEPNPNHAEHFGCWGQAMSLGAEFLSATEFDTIQAEVSRFRESVAVYPQVIALDGEWASCMSEVGYPAFANRAQLFDSMWDARFLIQNENARAELLGEWDWETNPDGPPGFVLNEDGTEWVWQDDQADAAAAFREREFALALADVDCREALDFDARALVINHQLQREFVDANLNELEAWATFVENQRAGR